MKIHSDSFLLLFFLLLPVLRSVIFSQIPLGYTIMALLLAFMIFYCAFMKSHNPSDYVDIPVVYSVIFLLFFFKFFGDSSMNVWLTREFGVNYIFMIGGIFGYGVVRVQQDITRMLSTLKIAGIILGLYYAYRSLEVLRNGHWTYYQFGHYWYTTSNMSWSYGVLLAICLLSIFLIIEKKMIFAIPMAVGLLGIMVYGSRGTVIALALGVVFAILFVNEGRLSTKNYVIIGVVTVITIFVFSDTGLSIIISWFQSHGLHSRFLNLLTSGESFEVASNGRSRIWDAVMKMMQSAPFFGYGVFGERNTLYSMGYKWGYSHNIALEILVAFGWVIGSAILIAIVVGIIRFFRSSTDKNERLMFVIFLTVSFELLLSNTIWFHYGIWCLFGMYVNHFKRKKQALPRQRVNQRKRVNQ